MIKQNDFIYSLYKPFRNQIRNYNLLDSLYLIWGYSRNFTFNLNFPSDIEKPNGFLPHEDINHRRYYSIPEFEQEFLLKEFILNCDAWQTKYSLKQKNKLSKLVNYLRFSFIDEIDKHFTTQGDFLLEFNRMAHRQFNWQLGYNPKEIFRYYKVYADKEVSTIIKNKFKLTTYEIFIIGFFFFRWSAEHFRTNLPFTSEFTLISDEMIEIFFQNFSMSMEEAKEELKASQQMNENLFYSFNPLRAKPILVYQNTFICPIQLLLFWQITGGIYYSIVKELGFENAFGNSFQNYIGEVLRKCCDNPNLKIIAEEKYGKEEMRTTDWILTDENAILFIECKAKRMTMLSKSELNIQLGLEGDLKKMASFITQLYKTYIEYTEDKYPQIAFDSSKKFIPLVITLEAWYINLNPRIWKMLREKVIENFNKRKISVSLIDNFPYHIRSSEDFEKDIQLINSLGILGYFDKVTKNELHDYIQNFNYCNPFEGEFEKIFIEPLETI
jgi:hypothetical protein